ncbi:MAG: hypothetical protein H6515_13165 [Microthrixaceae bacterium]|nr:hypothetical protein [Microthrixaceae bacterium]
MPKAPTHVYVGNPDYMVRLAAHGVVHLVPGVELTLTRDEAKATGADFEPIPKPSKSTAADAADTDKDND